MEDLEANSKKNSEESLEDFPKKSLHKFLNESVEEFLKKKLK